jgi:hypothetical protein
MTVTVSEDRSMCVQPHQVVRTAWIDIDLCKLGFRLLMSPEAVEKKFRRLLNLGDGAPWPPVVGHWEGERFLVDDGRHDYLAALMIGRDKLFVCWLETAPAAIERREFGSFPPESADSATSPTTSSANHLARLARDPLPSDHGRLWCRSWRRRRGSASNCDRKNQASAGADPLRLPASDHSRP